MEGNSKKAAPLAWVAIMAITTVAAGLCCAFLLWLQGTDGGLSPSFWAGIGLVCSGAVWFAAGLWGLFAYRAYLLTLVAPSLVLGSLGLLITGGVPKVAWWISRDAFAEAGVTCPASGSASWIGVYRIRRVEGWTDTRGHDGCLFYTDGGFLDRVGFAYLPNGAPSSDRPPSSDRIEYTPFEGNWYRFVEPFD